jgi:microcystin-dependent protein
MRRRKAGRTGQIKPFGQSVTVLTGEVEVAPGYLLCNGQAVSRMKYAALFSLIGTAYGTGDGSTTFNLPDLRGRAPHGQNSVGTYATRGVTGGAETVTLAAATLPAHNHTRGGSGGYGNMNNAAGSGSAFSGVSNTTTGNPASGSHNNLSPLVVVNYAIAY